MDEKDKNCKERDCDSEKETEIRVREGHSGRIRQRHTRKHREGGKNRRDGDDNPD